MQISLRRISSFRGILVYIKVIIIKNTDSKSKYRYYLYIAILLQYSYIMHTLDL